MTEVGIRQVSATLGGSAVTGGNMEPLRARMDFESGPLPERSGAEVGRFEVTKTESNCEANKRMRIALSDGQVARRQEVAVPAGSRTPASVRSSSPAPT